MRGIGRPRFVPFLDHPKLKKAIIKGINSYLINVDRLNIENGRARMRKRYNAKHPNVLYYFMHDAELQLRKEDEFLKRLYLEGTTSSTRDGKRFLELYRIFDVDEYDINLEGSPLEEEYIKLRYKMVDLHMSEHDMDQYCAIRACHWWNPTFGLTLARLVEPGEKWLVRQGDKHTTIINGNGTQIFDLQMWAIDGNRLAAYLFGDSLVGHTPTRGGAKAFVTSKDPPTWRR